MNAGDVALRLLSSIGRPREAGFYLAQFRKERREQFATIAVLPQVISDQLDTLTADLALLDKLELSPVLAFETEADLLRVEQVVTAAKTATVEGAAAVAAGGAIPLVLAPGAELPALVKTLSPHKVVLLDERLGLVLGTGDIPSLVDAAELPAMLPSLNPEQIPLVEAATAMLARGGRKLTVSITSPLHLLAELFTVRGAGTLLRNAAQVASHSSYDQLDRGQLGALMQSAFGKPVAAGFFDRAVERIYIAGDYDGAAVVAPTDLAPYLTKFAVGLRARGEGLGRDLWRALGRDYERLVWRARTGNPVASWYEQQCDGMVRTVRWQIFWRGLMPAEIPAAIDLAISAPIDF